MHTFVATLAVILLGLSSLLFVQLRAPLGFALLFAKLLAGALAPAIVLIGLITALTGLIIGSGVATVAGGLGALGAAIAWWRITAPQRELTAVFGPHGPGTLPLWGWRLPPEPEPRFTQNIPFWTIPETERTLLCDIWQPAPGVQPSGVAFLYFHGSAWYILDKDAGTRRFFRHLTAQGHVVMDVAYRLYPETDIPGMAGDVKRAIAWMKAHAHEYGVDPERIVIGGGSAGGHLSLLAAYTPQHPELTPPDLQGADLTVRGVVSIYGPTDLTASYTHTNQQKLPPLAPPDWTAAPSPLPRAIFGRNAERLLLHRAPVAGRMDWLMGGRPEEIPERYLFQSPVAHVSPASPPTLLIQGEDDLITPVAATGALHRKLQEAGVPTANVVLPHTDHGFDLALTAYSPSARAALHALDRFLDWIGARS